MNPEVEKMLRELATQLGTTVEYLWKVMVSGQQVEGYTTLAFAVLYAIGAFVAYRIMKKIAAIEDWIEEPHTFFGAMMSFCATVVLLILAMSNLSGVPQKLFTPEYAALKELLK